MRSLVFILILALVFMAGILSGIDRDKEVSHDSEHTTKQAEITSPETHGNDSEEISFIGATAEPKEHITHKAAAFLESGVKVFYDVIVEALFQISSLII